MEETEKNMGDGRALVLRTEPPAASPPSAAIPVAVRANLVKFRSRRGWSLQKAANAIGISKPHLWDLERGGSANPTLRTLESAARVYGVSLPELLFDGIYEGPQHKAIFDALDKCREMLRAEQSHAEALAQSIEAQRAETCLQCNEPTLTEEGERRACWCERAAEGESDWERSDER